VAKVTGVAEDSQFNLSSNLRLQRAANNRYKMESATTQQEADGNDNLIGGIHVVLSDDGDEGSFRDNDAVMFPDNASCGIHEGYETSKLPDIKFLPFDTLCELTSFPRCPDRNELTVSIDDIDKEDSLIIFVSHCWWRENDSSSSSATSSRIDSPNADQFRLCVQGISLLRTNFAGGLSNCYVWIDYSCLNQEDRPANEIIDVGLGRILETCDCIFTPLFDADSDAWSYPEIWRNKHEEYMSCSWRGNDSAYLNRAWCRMELFYNTVTPLSDQISLAKRSKFSSTLLHNHVEGKRPQFLYGSKEYTEEMLPLVVPPLALSFFESYHPMRGSMTYEADREIIEKLVSSLQEEIRSFEMASEANGAVIIPSYEDSESRGDVYEGEFLNNMMHGKGVFRYANGNIYEGDFYEDKRHGTGVFRYANGDLYEGNFYDGNFRGRGVFKFANGNVYEGEYRDGKWDGKGIFKFASGNVYEGEFQNDERHGRGRFQYVSGDVYDGDYANDKRHGKGTFRFANGNIFDGDFEDDCIHGTGSFRYANGDVYEGEYRDNKKHGQGKFRSRKGKIQEGTWIAGVYKGRNSYCVVM
jgi:hypothetical protein